MTMRKFLIAGGNSTALILDCPIEQRHAVSLDCLKQVEQAGFVDQENGLPRLTMMGGELCVNGTLALASLLGTSGIMHTSGLRDDIAYHNAENITEIHLPLHYRRDGNVILFEGIGFLVTDKQYVPTKRELHKLSTTYHLPAFGLAIVENGTLTPFVYVSDVNSLVKETACGSGSIATSIVYNLTEVRQPTGATIGVRSAKDYIAVRAKVEEV